MINFGVMAVVLIWDWDLKSRFLVCRRGNVGILGIWGGLVILGIILRVSTLAWIMGKSLLVVSSLVL